MKTMKKLVAAALAGVMTLAMGVSAFAATGVSSDEQALLDKATQKAQELGVDTNASAQFKQYYAEGERYLAETDLNAEQIAALSASIDDAAKTVKAEMDAQGVTKLGDLKAQPSVLQALENKVVAQVKTAADKVGITITVNADGSVTVKTAASNTPVADSSNPIKQTGCDLTATVVVAVAFAGAVAVCLVVASKKRFIEEA